MKALRDFARWIASVLGAACCLWLLVTPSQAQEPIKPCEATESFTADADVGLMNEAYALDAIDGARSNFGVELDWSDASVARVEEILGALHDQMGSAPSDDAVWLFAKAFGSYTGEVYRRNHGGTWGVVKLNGETFFGMQTHASCRLFWPWGRAHNRIINGPEDNVLHYYQWLLTDESQ